MNYHDMLAKQGIGSAHPGGFSATLDFLSHFPIKRGSRVLEVGCGTGRTACHLAKQGCQVTGVDIRPQMIEKARKRADFERVNVEFLEGNATYLPLEDNQFDVVFVESVTVFVNPLQAFREYYRVLKPGGDLNDREMMAISRFPRKVAEAVYKLYGAMHVPNLEEWITLLKQANFQQAGVWKPSSVTHSMQLLEEWKHPDPFPQMDEDAQQNPQISYLLERNLHVMNKYAKYMGFGVLLGTKE